MQELKFGYVVNGQTLSDQSLTSASFPNTFGHEEYVIVGSAMDGNDITDLQCLMSARQGSVKVQKEVEYNLQDDPQVFWSRNINEEFIARLWAFKRIKYFLDDNTDSDTCIQYNSVSAPNSYDYDYDPEYYDGEDCKLQAIRLALKYNFVVIDLTAMVVEENDKYVKKGKAKFKNS